MRIRFKVVDPNTQGRVGCQFQSPFTNQIYYATVEGGILFLRHYDGHELGKESEALGYQAGQLSACFASPGMVAVTVAGFTPGTNNSIMGTYVIPLAE